MCSANFLPRSIRWAFKVSEWRPSEREWVLAVRCLQKEEKDRIYRFVFSDDAKSSMIGQLLMRKASSESTGIPYNEIQFARTEAGKPFISNSNLSDLNFSFNVSHHGDFCVLAAERAHDNLVGIDVMKTEYTGSRPLSEYFSLMQKQFSFDEMEFITSPGSEAEQLKRFYRLWCLKESYVKAKGTGIACNLKAISFHCTTPYLCENITTNDTKLTVDGVFASSWRFEETLLDENHCVSVAVKTKQCDVEVIIEEINAPVKKFIFLNYDDLMKNSVCFQNADESDWLTFVSKKEKPT